MKNILIFFILFGVVGSYSQESSEKLKFEIRYRKNSVGIAIATKEIKGDTIVYQLQAEIRKQVLNIKKLDFVTYATFLDSTLIKTDYSLYVNEKLKKSSRLNYLNGSYKRELNGKKIDSIKTPITFASTMLLFQNPNGTEKTYSESKQIFRQIYYDTENPNVAKLGKNPDKIDTFYNYQDNKIQYLDVDGTINFKIVLIED